MAKNPRYPGRPKVFDSQEKLDQLKNLMRVYPSLEDTAAFFDTSASVIDNAIKTTWGVTFREFRQRYMVETRLNIRRAAIKKALGGDTMMIIFLLRAWCDVDIKKNEDGEDTRTALPDIVKLRNLVKKDPALARDPIPDTLKTVGETESGQKKEE